MSGKWSLSGEWVHLRSSKSKRSNTNLFRYNSTLDLVEVCTQMKKNERSRPIYVQLDGIGMVEFEWVDWKEGSIVTMYVYSAGWYGKGKRTPIMVTITLIKVHIDSEGRVWLLTENEYGPLWACTEIRFALDDGQEARLMTDFKTKLEEMGMYMDTLDCSLER